MASMSRSIQRGMARNGYFASRLKCPKCGRAMKHSGLGSRIACKCGWAGKVVRGKKDDPS